MTNKLTVILLALVVGLAACKDDSDSPQPSNNQTTTDYSILAIAKDNGNFTVLVDALERTGLDEVLSASGTYTVFAPSDSAFTSLLEDLGMNNLDELETALGNDGLKNVLLYHVLNAKVMSSEVTTGFVSSLGIRGGNEGQYLSMFINAGSSVMINDIATVTMPDVKADNGVIHVIDHVILPLDIVQLALLSPDHTSLVGALEQADGDLVNVLSSDGPFTVFAPVNSAFDAISATVATLDAAQLSTVLTYHVVSGNIQSEEVQEGVVSTVAEQDITISTDNGVSISDANGGMANVIATDIQGTNGVIHVLDAVLVPNL